MLAGRRGKPELCMDKVPSVIGFPFRAGMCTVAGRYFWTGSSSETSPFCTISARTVDVKTFEMEPISNTLLPSSGGWPGPGSPYATTRVRPLASSTPTTMPAARFSSTRRLMMARMAESGGSDCAARVDDGALHTGDTNNSTENNTGSTTPSGASFIVDFPQRGVGRQRRAPPRVQQDGGGCNALKAGELPWMDSDPSVAALLQDDEQGAAAALLQDDEQGAAATLPQDDKQGAARAAVRSSFARRVASTRSCESCRRPRCEPMPACSDRR